MAASKCRVALLQLLSGADKVANVKAAVAGEDRTVSFCSCLGHQTCHLCLAAIAEAASHKADIVTLPECFNSPYATASFPVYAEFIPATRSLIEPSIHPTTAALSDAAREHGIFLVGGRTIGDGATAALVFIARPCLYCQDPSLSGTRRVTSLTRVSSSAPMGRYSQSTARWGVPSYIMCLLLLTTVPRRSTSSISTSLDAVRMFQGAHKQGSARYQSAPRAVTFRESDTLTGGSTLTTFDTPFGRCGTRGLSRARCCRCPYIWFSRPPPLRCSCGVGICYDMRFPLLSALMSQAGCRLLFFPGAFNTTTGPAHWELLQARAPAAAQWRRGRLGLSLY